jgi:hypothetical protein
MQLTKKLVIWQPILPFGGRHKVRNWCGLPYMGMFCQILPDTFTYSAICRGNCQPGKIRWQVGRLLPTTLHVCFPVGTLSLLTDCTWSESQPQQSFWFWSTIFTLFIIFALAMWYAHQPYCTISTTSSVTRYSQKIWAPDSFFSRFI